MLSGEKRQFLTDHLVRSAQDFERSIATSDPGRWSVRPQPECWSIGEIAEHVLIIDTRVGTMAAALKDWPPEPYTQENTDRKDAMILRIAVERGTRIEAPGEVRPTGRLESAEQFYLEFHKAHERLALAAAEDAELLRGRFRDHPFLKKLDGYQWLLVCSCHRRRHLDQIEEVKRVIAQSIT